MSDTGHIWRAPPPGAGNERVCERCGTRESQARLPDARKLCVVAVLQPRPVKFDYDPLGGDAA